MKNPSQSAKADQLDDGDGSTFHTFRALMDHLKKYQPPFYIGENLDELANANTRIHQALREEMLDAGFSVVCKVLKASDFGSPSRRIRTYIVAIHATSVNMGGQSEAQALATQVQSSLVSN